MFFSIGVSEGNFCLLLFLKGYMVIVGKLIKINSIIVNVCWFNCIVIFFKMYFLG